MFPVIPESFEAFNYISNHYIPEEKKQNPRLFIYTIHGVWDSPGQVVCIYTGKRTHSQSVDPWPVCHICLLKHGSSGALPVPLPWSVLCWVITQPLESCVIWVDEGLLMGQLSHWKSLRFLSASHAHRLFHGSRLPPQNNTRIILLFPTDRAGSWATVSSGKCWVEKGTVRVCQHTLWTSSRSFLLKAALSLSMRLHLFLPLWFFSRRFYISFSHLSLPFGPLYQVSQLRGQCAIFSRSGNQENSFISIFCMSKPKFEILKNVSCVTEPVKNRKGVTMVDVTANLMIFPRICIM